MRSATRAGRGLLLTVAALAGCGGGGGGSDPAWYYHFACNGDSQCASLNPTSGTSGSLNQGTGSPGQTNCNSLITFGNINWNIPPAQHVCSQSPNPPSPAVTLSVAPTAIQLGQSATLTWSSSIAASCTASNAWAGARSLNGSQVVTPGAGGSFTYTLGCTGFGNTTSRSVTLAVNAPTVSLSLTPSTITDGQSSTLAWSSNDTASCTASDTWTGMVALSGNQPVSPSTGSFTYTLDCIGTGGAPVTGSATLTVNPSGALEAAPTVTLSASGNPAVVTWSTAHATSCVANGSWVGEKALSGTETMLFAQSPGHYDYALSCNGSGGSGTAAATVNVPSSGQVLCSPASVNIAVSPAPIAEGQASTLTWSASKDPFCSSPLLDCTPSGSWSGTVAASGTLGVAPSAGSFVYVLTCASRNATVSRSASLTVTETTPPPTPTVDVTLSPNPINLGESSTLSWTSSGVRSCTASGAWSGALALSGSTTVTPNAVGSHDYTLTCLGSGASTADTATLGVQ